MISKDKVFIISDNIDDSIRNTCVYSDIFIYKTFNEFEEYININPIDTDMIILNSKVLNFTSSSMDRIINSINSTFVTLNGFLYYMVDNESVKNKVESVLKSINEKRIKCVLCNTLYAKDVSDILNGITISTKETVVEVKTYRIRAEDYVRSQNDKLNLEYENLYETDEDQLSGIPNEDIPDDLKFSEYSKASRIVVCGLNMRETSAWVLLKAQYLSLSGKTLILERDIEYHTLLDMVSKIDISYEFFDIKDMFKDCYDFIHSIKESKNKLIVVGSINKVEYDYDVIMDILTTNLEYDIDFYLYQTFITKIPYGTKVDIVTPTSVPEILKISSKMSSISDFNDLYFVGLNITNLGSVCITNIEYNKLLQVIFSTNYILSSVVKVNGLLLRKEIGMGGIFMYN